MSDERRRRLERDWKAGDLPQAAEQASRQPGFFRDLQLGLRRRLVRALKTYTIDRARQAGHPIMSAPIFTPTQIRLASLFESNQVLPVHLIDHRSWLIHDGALLVVLPPVIHRWVDRHHGLTIWVHGSCQERLEIMTTVYRWQAYVELNVILTPTETP